MYEPYSGRRRVSLSVKTSPWGYETDRLPDSSGHPGAHQSGRSAQGVVWYGAELFHFAAGQSGRGDGSSSFGPVPGLMRDEHPPGPVDEGRRPPPPFASARYFPPMVDFPDEEEWTQDRID